MGASFLKPLSMKGFFIWMAKGWVCRQMVEGLSNWWKHLLCREDASKCKGKNLGVLCAQFQTLATFNVLLISYGEGIVGIQIVIDFMVDMGSSWLHHYAKGYGTYIHTWNRRHLHISHPQDERQRVWGMLNSNMRWPFNPHQNREGSLDGKGNLWHHFIALKL